MVFQHFHRYVYDRHVTIITDQKPLLQIFSSRIQQWMLRLQPYDFEMKYIPGREMASDYLSRNPQNQISADYTVEHFISMIVFDAVPKAYTLKKLISSTKSDETLQQVMKFVTSGRWSHYPRYHIYRQIQDHLPINNDLLLKHNCIVIPSALQQVLQLAHSQHQGISKTNAFLREKVWWLSINRDVEQLIKSCHACQITTASKYKCQPLKMSEIPKSA